LLRVSGTKDCIMKNLAKPLLLAAVATSVLLMQGCGRKGEDAKAGAGGGSGASAAAKPVDPPVASTGTGRVESRGGHTAVELHGANGKSWSFNASSKPEIAGLDNPDFRSQGPERDKANKTKGPRGPLRFVGVARRADAGWAGRIHSCDPSSPLALPCSSAFVKTSPASARATPRRVLHGRC
jgi:hypothetical protein